MIVGIQGNQGTGKTALMTWLARHYFHLGYKIHTNYWLQIPGLEPHYVTCLDDIDKIYSGYSFFDEFWSWIDSRISGYSETNLALTSILMKARKRGYSIFYESKRMHFADRRIRELTDYVLEPQVWYNNRGTLEKIEQNMLYPIKLEKYLDKLYVVVEKYQLISETQMRKMDDEDEIIFKITDVMNLYDTREEIGSIAEGEKYPGIEKGIRKETAISRYLRQIAPDMEIAHAKNSRGWDITAGNMVFDVVSPRKDNRGTKETLRIDVRRKNAPNGTPEGRLSELIKDANQRNLKPFWAWNYKGEWYALPIKDHDTKVSTVNCTDAHKLDTLIQEYKKGRII